LGSLVEIRDGDHVLVVGAILAAAAGVAYNTTAAIQKHEVVRVGAPPRRLLPALLLRPWWLAALLLDLAAWTAQTAAMALAPLVVVVPLLALGAALLVVLGVGWLGERFGRAELLAVALIAVGVALVALAAGEVTVARAPLPAATQLAVAALAAGAALAAMCGRSGSAYGAAAGCLYAATAVLSKEIGDRVASLGLRALPLLVASPTPWLLALLAGGALWLVQVGFQRANAASVTAAMTALESLGPILAGFLLYRERWPAGGHGVLLLAGALLAVVGLTALAARGHAQVGGAAPQRT
jgi:drug/metabolite transporter (DMT)-like permease